MGKARKSKARALLNPLGIPSIREIEQNEDEWNNDDQPHGPVQAILNELRSPNTEEKMIALQSLATHAKSFDNIEEICSGEIIRVAAPFLVDPNPNIRNATTGALLSLSVAGGADISEIMVDRDVLTPLLALLTEYANLSDWTPTFDKTMNNQLDEKSDTFLNAINLLWNLCESTSTAVDNFNETQLLPKFLRFLNLEVFGVEISVSVAQFLVVISEDNPSAWCTLSTHIADIVPLLDIEGKEAVTLLRILAAGVISNIPALCAAYSNQIIFVISKTLEINHRMQICELSSKIPLSGEEDLKVDNSENLVSEDETEEDAARRRLRQDLPSELDLEMKNLGYLLQAQRIAAETISNMCLSDDEAMDIKDDDESESESVQDYDTSNEVNSCNLQKEEKLPVEIVEAIKSLEIVKKLWNKSLPLPENVHEILCMFDTSDELLVRLASLRSAAMLGIQNLCNVMLTEDLGGMQNIYGMWLNLGQQVFQGQQEINIVEASTSLMRAALKHLKASPALFKQMSKSDLQLMLNGVQSCSMPEIRANWLRMLGILGCLLSEQLVKLIMEFILHICLQENDAWTLSEAIDALMDMFSDNDWKQIAYDLNLAWESKQLKRILKTKIRQQKRELKDRYPAVLTVDSNLGRFITYIENQMKDFRPTKIT